MEIWLPNISEKHLHGLWIAQAFSIGNFELNVINHFPTKWFTTTKLIVKKFHIKMHSMFFCVRPKAFQRKIKIIKKMLHLRVFFCFTQKFFCVKQKCFLFYTKYVLPLETFVGIPAFKIFEAFFSRGGVLPHFGLESEYSGDLKSRLVWISNGWKEIGLQMVWILNGIWNL